MLVCARPELQVWECGLVGQPGACAPVTERPRTGLATAWAEYAAMGLILRARSANPLGAVQVSHQQISLLSSFLYDKTVNLGAVSEQSCR